jgi:hypothetical protein
MSALPCPRCHGTHLVANPAWTDRAGDAETASEETYARTPEAEVLFARIHGAKLLPCPACVPKVGPRTPPSRRRRARKAKARAQRALQGGH